MRDKSLLHGECAKWAVYFMLMVLAASGCSHGPAGTGAQAKLSEQKVFDLKETTPERGKALLSELSMGEVSIPPSRNALCVAGTASDLYRAGVVLDLVDTREEFVTETLVPVSDARTIPMNAQIAEAIGGVAIGTFATPPKAGERQRAIIDIHGRSVVAILPASIHRELIAFIRLGPEGLQRIRGDDGRVATPVAKAQADPQEVRPGDSPSEIVSTPIASDQPKPAAVEATPATLTSMPQDIALDVTAKLETVASAVSSNTVS